MQRRQPGKRKGSPLAPYIRIPRGICDSITTVQGPVTLRNFLDNLSSAILLRDELPENCKV